MKSSKETKDKIFYLMLGIFSIAFAIGIPILSIIIHQTAFFILLSFPQGYIGYHCMREYFVIKSGNLQTEKWILD